MDQPVVIKETTLIKPSDPTPHCVLNLSAVDSQLFLRFTIEYVLIYEPHPSLNRVDVTNRLKNSLGRVLVRYYPLAGRVAAVPDSTNLKVVCEEQGVLFIEAEAVRWTFPELNRIPGSVSQWRSLLTEAVEDVLAGSPAVVVQLTWLAGGGAVLAVGFNHCLTDGIGSAGFINSLAGETGPVDLVWDRHLLNRKLVPVREIDPTAHPEFHHVDDVSDFASRFAERHVPTSFCFTKTRLDSMRECISTSGDFTCFEILAGLVWRNWASAMGLLGRQVVKLLFSVNIRTLVKPNLPSGYYGNGFVLGCARTTVKDLTSNAPAHAAMLVKRAKERIGDEFVKDVIDLVSGSSRRPDFTGVLILSEWSKLGLERVDFGLGRPVHVSSVCVDRYCLFIPVPRKPGAVKVMVALPVSAVGKYRRLMRKDVVDSRRLMMS